MTEAAEGGAQRKRGKTKRWQWVLAGVIGAFLALHTAVPDDRVDATTLGLLVLMLIVFLSGRLTKLKYGDFEAELETAIELQMKMVEKAAEEPPLAKAETAEAREEKKSKGKLPEGSGPSQVVIDNEAKTVRLDLDLREIAPEWAWGSPDQRQRAELLFRFAQLERGLRDVARMEGVSDTARMNLPELLAKMAPRLPPVEREAIAFLRSVRNRVAHGEPLDPELEKEALALVGLVTRALSRRYPGWPAWM